VRPIPIVALLMLAACGSGSVSNGSGGIPPPPQPPMPSPPSSNASIANLNFEGTFDQLFQSGQSDYTATLGFLVRHTFLFITLADANASLSINGGDSSRGQDFFAGLLLEPGPNTVDLEVTAEDGTTTRSYSVTFTRETADQFAQDAYVKASNASSGDRFGNSISLSGDTLAVGAFLEDSSATGVDGNQNSDNAPNAGAVYVFTRDAAGVWSQQAYLKASNAGAGDHFGISIALLGDTLAVGASREDSDASGLNGDQANDNATDSGAVYVFTRDASGTWSQQAYVKASNTGSQDYFGASVALHRGVPAVGSSAPFGYTLAVGAIGEQSNAVGIGGDQNNNDAPDAGAVYVYRHHGDWAWSQQAYIKASNTDAGDLFGAELGLFDHTLAVGAYREDSSATGVDGDQSNNDAPDSGAVYLFSRDEDEIWRQSAYLKASNAGAGDHFGRSLSLNPHILVVGADLEDGGVVGVNADDADDSANDAGAAYIFEQGMDAWSQRAYIKASNTDAGDRFGSSIALYDSTLAIGAFAESSSTIGIEGDPHDDTAGLAGAVYVFNRGSAGEWAQSAYVKASNSHALAAFGGGVALDGDTLAVASEFERGSGNGVNGSQILGANESGAVYVFR
jgi:trimeric autotransporter adhesin